jgi:hypothetical protein
VTQRPSACKCWGRFGSYGRDECPVHRDWRPIATAPRDATDIRVRDENGTENVAHFAHGGGEDQPPYGPAFFVKVGSYNAELRPQPIEWLPVKTSPTQKEST